MVDGPRAKPRTARQGRARSIIATAPSRPPLPLLALAAAAGATPLLFQQASTASDRLTTGHVDGRQVRGGHA